MLRGQSHIYTRHTNHGARVYAHPSQARTNTGGRARKKKMADVQTRVQKLGSFWTHKRAERGDVTGLTDKAATHK